MWPYAKRILRHLPAVLGVVLLVGAVFVVQREFRTSTCAMSATR